MARKPSDQLNITREFINNRKRAVDLDAKEIQQAVKKIRARLAPLSVLRKQEEIKKEKKKHETSKQKFIQKYVKAGFTEAAAKLLWDDFAQKSDIGHDHHTTWAT